MDLHHLNEIERRRLHLDRGFSSLYDYCVRHLKYSSSAAARRIQELFEEVRALLSRDGSNPSMADVMRAALTEYRDRHSPVARKARREAKAGSATVHSRRRECNDAPKARHVPDQVRHEVFARDRGKCTFTATDGTRCDARRGVQLDHIVPYSAGGTHDPSNLRLLCAAHNLRAAERALGTDVMAPFWRRE